MSQSGSLDFLPDTQIEVFNPLAIGSGKGSFPQFVMFDMDGTVSTLRKGWDTEMKTMMIDSIFGSAESDTRQAHAEEVESAVHHLIASSAGLQSIDQMVAMMKLIQQFSFFPIDEMLTAEEYAGAYRNRIEKVSRERIRQFKAKQLTLDDLTIRGVLRFIGFLRENGVSVFLASGSHYDDIVDETEKLGYRHLFNGGVYGSNGISGTNPKRQAVSRMQEMRRIRRGSSAFSDCVVFGDGPVDITEGKAAGFLAIGLASSDDTGYGLNLKKRGPLMNAGADLLIPDYSEFAQLSTALGWTS